MHTQLHAVASIADDLDSDDVGRFGRFESNRWDDGDFWLTDCGSAAEWVARGRPMCPDCGEPQLVKIHEVWGRDFLLETCCDVADAWLAWELGHTPEHDSDRIRSRKARQATPDFATELLRACGIEHILGRRLRRVANQDGSLILDFKPQLASIEWRAAREFVLEHHEHDSCPAGWRFGQSLYNGADRVGVVIVGNPASRVLTQRGQVLEVTRCCVRRDLPGALVWNACSQLYGWAAREIERRGWMGAITYTKEDEHAASLKAAGWHCDGPAGGGTWDRPSRARAVREHNEGPKLRWSKSFVKTGEFKLAA